MLRHGTIYDELKIEAKTASGDAVLVFDTPKDGNCLPTAAVRGLLADGYPLSSIIEHQAMCTCRIILSDCMRAHDWPHQYVASHNVFIQLPHLVNGVARLLLLVYH